MRKIRICQANLDRIQAALKAVQGRKRERIFTAEGILRDVRDWRDAALFWNRRDGKTIAESPTSSSHSMWEELPKSYKYPYSWSEIRISHSKNGDYLASVNIDAGWPG